ncbi:MAG: ABC transporter permease [Solirubrobacteraceae bacterium]|nr:ABC transporter permease [Solirubrobacteraceae bacterium]
MIRASWALMRRSLRNAFRRPQFLAPLVVFPSLFLAVNTGGLQATTGLPGFPEVESFLDFQLAAAICQSTMIGGVTAGIAMALDIEAGFFDRLVVSPIPRTAIVMGRVGAAGVLGAFQVVWFLVIGWIFGASMASGPGGVIVVIALGMLAAFGFGAIGVLIALRARSASTVQGIFPLVIVFLFLSSAFFPVDLMTSPADVIAQINPISFVADGLRQPIAFGWDTEVILEGFLAAAAIALVSTGLAIRALHGRLRAAR